MGVKWHRKLLNQFEAKNLSQGEDNILWKTRTKNNNKANKNKKYRKYTITTFKKLPLLFKKITILELLNLKTINTFKRNDSLSIKTFSYIFLN